MSDMTLRKRTDVGPNERCYEAVDASGNVVGYVQEYQNGTAAYWRELMQQAKPAASIADALRCLAA